MKKVIFIEGTTSQENGSLRKSFNQLLSKELKGSMPQIVMGDGKTQTIDKFHTRPVSSDEVRFLLVDSDKPLSDKQVLVDELNSQRAPEQRKVTATCENTFFMVQEAEAWIMSQPDVLKQQKIKTELLPKQDIQSVSDPSDVLADVYKKSGKEYHKVKEFVKVFSKLDTSKLKTKFSEFDELIKKIK